MANKEENKYKVYRGEEVYIVSGDTRNEAIYNLHLQTGMPEDFIKNNFFARRLFEKKEGTSCGS